MIDRVWASFKIERRDAPWSGKEKRPARGLTKRKGFEGKNDVTQKA
jgi:hypothetical protein